jgi:MFS family permease
MAFARGIWMLMLGRFIVGLGVGVTAEVIPLYLSEVAPTEIRGELVAINVAMITIGQLTSVLVSLALIPSWRLMLGIAVVPAVLQIIGLIFIPESPKWLMEEGLTDWAN